MDGSEKMILGENLADTERGTSTLVKLKFLQFEFCLQEKLVNDSINAGLVLF